MSNDSLNSDFRDKVFSPSHERLLGNNPRIRDINKLIQELAPAHLTVLITGETGTGKDIVARLIHNLGARARRPFVKINCPSVPEEMWESELFGYERGAFTGAHTSRPGRLELARDGTVFLDEIAETTLSAQNKLIQVLDGEPIMRIGGTRAIPMKARIVAAIGRALDDAVERGRLSKDIAFRLREVVIQLPPLRERRDDIPLLAEHFNYHACRMLNKEYTELAPDVLEQLKALPWPGNVRQLAGRVKEFVATGSYGDLFEQGAAHGVASGANGEATRQDPSAPRAEPEAGRFMPLKEARRLAAESAERSLIEETLRYTLWNRRKAAKLLRTSYSSLLRRIDSYGIGKS